MNLILKNIENGYLDLALKEIIAYPFSNDIGNPLIDKIRNDAIFDLGRFNSVRSDLVKGLITKQEENELLDKIRYSIFKSLELMKQIEMPVHSEKINESYTKGISLNGVWAGRMSKSLSIKTPVFVFINNDFGVGGLYFIDANRGGWKWDSKNDRIIHTKWKYAKNMLEIVFEGGFIKYLTIQINDNKVDLICIEASKNSWIGIRGTFKKEIEQMIE